jgi:hypothetical protein
MSVTRLTLVLYVQPQPVASCLSEDKNGMNRIMLEVVASRLITRPEHIRPFLLCTLLSAQHFEDGKVTPEWVSSVQGACISSLKQLCNQGFVRWRPDEGATRGSEGTYEPQPLARATISAALPPSQAMLLYEDVSEFVDGANLRSDLHFLYLIAPAVEDKFVKWQNVHRVLDARCKNGSGRKVAELAKIDLRLAFKERGREGFTPQVRFTRSPAWCTAKQICSLAETVPWRLHINFEHNSVMHRSPSTSAGRGKALRTRGASYTNSGSPSSSWTLSTKCQPPT